MYSIALVHETKSYQNKHCIGFEKKNVKCFEIPALETLNVIRL